MGQMDRLAPGTSPLGLVADQVRSRADIVEIVSEFVALRPAGRSYKGLCPFHSEKTPSFTVSPDRQLFYCFGCGAGGNVFTFLMKLQGIGFTDALLRVAERVGMAAEVERVLHGGARDRFAEVRERLVTLQEQAAEWFSRQLWHSPEGEMARNYLARRGVSREVAQAFRLGYAPQEWHALEKALGRSRETLELLRQAGLIVEREDGLRYDRFRGRLLFPIADARGRVVGFGGRALSADQEPKYLNSPESPVYQKSRILYGLDRAAPAIRKGGRVVVVEGYMDVLAMHQFGLAEAVATCGTSLTGDHGRMLARLAPQVVVAFDSDAAGQSGALRGLEQLRAAGLDVRVAVIPAPHDPDSLLKSEGRPAMERVLAESRGVYEFSVEQALKGADPGSPAGKAAAVAKLLPILAAVPSAVEQEALVQAVASRLDIAPHAIRRDLEAVIRSRRGGGPGARQTHSRAGSAYNVAGVRASASRLESAPHQANVIERELLRLLIEMPEVGPRLRGRLTGADFTGPGYAALFDALVERGEAALADPELAALAGSIVASSELAIRPQAVESYVQGLRVAREQRELTAIEAKIEAVTKRAGSPGERLALLAELAVSYREVWERLRSEGAL
ncbi:MAG: DNA primase [Limnochordaceae bacterium]|nr:DNA primase [Limnochordaceae bacterium]